MLMDPEADDDEGSGLEAPPVTHSGDRDHFTIKEHIRGMRTHKGKVTTLIYGRNENYKILRYDAKALVERTAWLTILNSGTVFTMDNTAMLNVLVMLVVGAVTVMICLALSWDDISALGELKVGPLTDLAKQMNAFVPFCLGLYVALILARWWALRQRALGQVLEAFANTVMMVSCELHADKWTRLRNQVAKYGFASVELLIQAARGTEDASKLVQPGFLTGDEYNILQEAESWHRPLMIWSWIMRICTAAMDHNKVPAPRVGSVVLECIRAREGMASINAHLDTQLPFAYVHLITLLVNMQNLLTSITAGITFATAFARQEYFLMGKQIVMLVTVVFIYQALLQISYMIMDPFGDDVLDFPIKAYTTYVANTVDAILEAQPECLVVSEDGELHRPVPKETASPVRVYEEPKEEAQGCVQGLLRSLSIGKMPCCSSDEEDELDRLPQSPMASRDAEDREI